jgi:hypothetical protein
MDKLTRRHLTEPLIKGSKRSYYKKEYIIYTKSEAEELKVAFKPWYECKVGEFGLSDDNYVAVCLKVKYYQDKHNRRYLNFTYPYGQMFYRPFGKKVPKLLYEKHRDSGDYTGTSTRPRWEQNVTKRQYQRFAQAYAIMLVNGNVDWEALGKIFSADEPNPAIKAKMLLKKRYVKEMIHKQVEEALTLKNVTRTKVIEMLLKCFDKAEKKDDVTNMRQVAEDFADMLQMTKEDKASEWDETGGQIEPVEEALKIEEGQEEKLLSEGADSKAEGDQGETTG